MKNFITVSLILVYAASSAQQSYNLGTGNVIWLHSANEVNWTLGKDNNHNVNIFGYGFDTRRFRILNSVNSQELFNVNFHTGNVGIGTPAPSAKLHIVSPGGVYSGLLLESSNSYGYATLDLKNSAGDLAQVSFNSPSSQNGMALSRQVVLSSGAPNGISLIAYDVNGFITFGTGGISTAKERMRITYDGNVGIGTTTPGSFKLAVNGKVWAQEVQVAINNPGPDYVFEPNYKLLSLEEIKTYIDQHKHLPEVPSAKEMETNGVNVSEMNMLLLKKIEELTLHIINQEKRISELERKSTNK